MNENNGTKRVFGMLGLAMKAGKVVIGTEQVIAYLQKSKLRLVLVSGSSSENTKNKVRFKCEFYKTSITELNVESDELGRLLGKTYAPAVVGITDENFANVIMKILNENNG